MTHPTPRDGRLARLLEICLGLPEVETSSHTGQHTAFEVRGRKFAYYLVDHHGDGRVALTCKAGPGMRDVLVASSPHRFFVPPYLGPKGWVALDLDAAPIDWDEIAALVTGSYLLVAPKTLAGRVSLPA